MKLYHFTNQQYGLENIKKRRLKVARISKLNDPFELRGVDLTDPDDDRYFAEFKERMDKVTGLICFSKNWTNPVHWSHYADHHKGICLGFDITDDSVSKIIYTNDVMKFDRSAASKSQTLEAMMLSHVAKTKFKHWEYEQEYRTMVRIDCCSADSGYHFYNFSNSMSLSEIIVGSDSNATRKEIDEALGELRKTVICKKARLAFKSFEVTEELDASLWL
jgi:hypothetical protein